MRRLRASWIQETSSPSILVWRKSISSPSLSARVAAALFEIGQGLLAVDLGLAHAEHVEIGPVEDEDRFAPGVRPGGCRSCARLIGGRASEWKRALFELRMLSRACSRPPSRTCFDRRRQALIADRARNERLVDDEGRRALDA